jgi:hypothetical protein
MNKHLILLHRYRQVMYLMLDLLLPPWHRHRLQK